MPELPEVETTVRDLRKYITGRTIRDFWTDWPKSVHHPASVPLFRKAVRGKKILSVTRRAKYIIIDLEGDSSIFVHQKMSGHLLYGQWKKAKGKWRSILPGVLSQDPKNRFIRSIFELDNSHQLALSDLRRFATLRLVHDSDIQNIPALKNLGPEPLTISLKDFEQLFHKKRGNVKPVLMDPAFIVGIGNIYADEILWEVGLHPLTRVESLSKKHIARIYEAMKEILQEAIRLKGSSLDDYRRPSGAAGAYQTVHRAYHKTGEPCSRKDGGIIERMVLQARSAHFCSHHQIKL